MKDWKDLKITKPQLLIGLAVLTAIGWLWALADNGIPYMIFFLFGVAAPIALFILLLTTVLSDSETKDSNG